MYLSPDTPMSHFIVKRIFKYQDRSRLKFFSSQDQTMTAKAKAQIAINNRHKIKRVIFARLRGLLCCVCSKQLRLFKKGESKVDKRLDVIALYKHLTMVDKVFSKLFSIK